MISKGKLRYLKSLLRVNHRGHFYCNTPMRVTDVSKREYQPRPRQLPFIAFFTEKGPTHG